MFKQCLVQCSLAINETFSLVDFYFSDHSVQILEMLVWENLSRQAVSETLGPTTTPGSNLNHLPSPFYMPKCTELGLAD